MSGSESHQFTKRKAPAELALMICTYRRPKFLEKLVDSINELRVPAGIKLVVVIADNNPLSEYDTYIGALASRLAAECVYTHEPKTGYASIRNKAIDAALTTKADIFAFVDDDFELHPDWMVGQVRSYAEFDANCILGSIAGRKAKYRHGEVRPRCGIGNASFQRQWVDPLGLGLRFDTQYDKTGGEDFAFTSEAVNRGQKIVYSEYPVVIDRTYEEQQLAASEQHNRALVFAVNAQNRIAQARRDQGPVVALAYALVETRHLAKAAKSYAKSLWLSALGKAEQSSRCQAEAKGQASRMLGAWRGLSGQFVERQSVRRSQ